MGAWLGGVYARPSVFGRVLGRMHGRVARWCVCTAEWLGGVYARPSGSVVCMHGRVLGRIHGRVARRFVMLGLDFPYARLGRERGSVGRDASTVWSRRIHGLVATHGLVAHGLNFKGMTEPCG